MELKDVGFGPSILENHAQFGFIFFLYFLIYIFCELLKVPSPRVTGILKTFFRDLEQPLTGLFGPL